MIIEKKDIVEIDDSNVEKKDLSIDVADLGIAFQAFLRYKDPIAAFVRELVSNAYDANVENNMPTAPIVVGTLYDESYKNIIFSVKDYGIGFSPERIELVFSKLFKSTKRHDNTQIGGFGLGSKSPLGYADEYTIHTVHNNIKYTYLVSKTNTVPTIYKLEERQAFEEDGSGTTVEVAVKVKDSYTLKNALIRNLQFFETVSIKAGSLYSAEEILFQYNKAKSYVIINENSFNSPYIIIGKVYYPLEISTLLEFFEHNETKKELIQKMYVNKSSNDSITDLLKYGITFPDNFGLYFDIGELEVQWNRDNIIYNTHNIELIIERITQAYNEYVEYCSNLDIDVEKYIKNLFEIDKYEDLNRILEQNINPFFINKFRVTVGYIHKIKKSFIEQARLVKERRKLVVKKHACDLSLANIPRHIPLFSTENLNSYNKLCSVLKNLESTVYPVYLNSIEKVLKTNSKVCYYAPSFKEPEEEEYFYKEAGDEFEEPEKLDFIADKLKTKHYEELEDFPGFYVASENKDIILKLIPLYRIIHKVLREFFINHQHYYKNITFVQKEKINKDKEEICLLVGVIRKRDNDTVSNWMQRSLDTPLILYPAGNSANIRSIHEMALLLRDFCPKLYDKAIVAEAHSRLVKTIVKDIELINGVHYKIYFLDELFFKHNKLFKLNYMYNNYAYIYKNIKLESSDLLWSNKSYYEKIAKNIMSKYKNFTRYRIDIINYTDKEIEEYKKELSLVARIESTDKYMCRLIEDKIGYLKEENRDKIISKIFNPTSFNVIQKILESTPPETKTIDYLYDKLHKKGW